MNSRLIAQAATAYELQPHLKSLPVRSSSLAAGVPAAQGPTNKFRQSHMQTLAGNRLRLEGDLAGARQLLQQALESFANNPLAHAALGATLREAGELSAAESHLRQALALRPSDEFTQAQLGVTLWQQGRQTLALVYLRQAQASRPDNALTLTALASLAYHNVAFKQARTLFVQSLRIDPNQAYAQARLGELNLRTHHLRSARVHLERALALEPTDLFTLARLGEVERQLGNLPQAIAFGQKALAGNPQDTFAAVCLSKAFASSGKITTSLHYAAQAVEAAPRSSSAVLQLASCLEADARSLDDKGLYAEGQGRYEQAIACLQSLQADRPKLQEAHAALGRVYLANKQPDLAKAALQRALELSAGDTALELLYAEASWDVDGAAAALQRFTEAAARAPEHAFAKECLQDCQSHQTAAVSLQITSTTAVLPPQLPNKTKENVPVQAALVKPSRSSRSLNSLRSSLKAPQMVAAKSLPIPPQLSVASWTPAAHDATKS